MFSCDSVVEATAQTLFPVRQHTANATLLAAAGATSSSTTQSSSQLPQLTTDGHTLAGGMTDPSMSTSAFLSSSLQATNISGGMMSAPLAFEHESKLSVTSNSTPRAVVGAATGMSSELGHRDLSTFSSTSNSTMPHESYTSPAMTLFASTSTNPASAYASPTTSASVYSQPSMSSSLQSHAVPSAMEVSYNTFHPHSTPRSPQSAFDASQTGGISHSRSPIVTPSSETLEQQSTSTAPMQGLPRSSSGPASASHSAPIVRPELAQASSPRSLTALAHPHLLAQEPSQGSSSVLQSPTAPHLRSALSQSSSPHAPQSHGIVTDSSHATPQQAHESPRCSSGMQSPAAGNCSSPNVRPAVAQPSSTHSLQSHSLMTDSSHAALHQQSASSSPTSPHCLPSSQLSAGTVSTQFVHDVYALPQSSSTSQRSTVPNQSVSTERHASHSIMGIPGSNSDSFMNRLYDLVRSSPSAAEKLQIFDLFPEWRPLSTSSTVSSPHHSQSIGHTPTTSLADNASGMSTVSNTLAQTFQQGSAPAHVSSGAASGVPQTYSNHHGMQSSSSNSQEIEYHQAVASPAVTDQTFVNSSSPSLLAVATTGDDLHVASQPHHHGSSPTSSASTLGNISLDVSPSTHSGREVRTSSPLSYLSSSAAAMTSTASNMPSSAPNLSHGTTAALTSAPNVHVGQLQDSTFPSQGLTSVGTTPTNVLFPMPSPTEAPPSSFTHPQFGQSQPNFSFDASPSNAQAFKLPRVRTNSLSNSVISQSITPSSHILPDQSLPFLRRTSSQQADPFTSAGMLSASALPNSLADSLVRTKSTSSVNASSVARRSPSISLSRQTAEVCF